MLKKVKYLIPSEDINMGGISLKQALPTHKVPHLDPFILLHHAEFTFRDDAPAHHQGIGPHPHRGFSPVTFVIEGEIRHQDSRGNDQIAKKGEIQWMHAGAGIIHSERPTQDLIDNNGTQEIIQLWINSPSSSKMLQPLYQYNATDQMVAFNSSDEKIFNKLVAGNYASKKGKICTESELLVIWSTANKDGNQVYSIPKENNVMLYLIKGEIKIKGYGFVEAKQLTIFEIEGNQIEVTAISEAQYLILSGKPINEKIVQSGPYVMNNQTQIMQAMRDYQMGKMGILIESE